MSNEQALLGLLAELYSDRAALLVQLRQAQQELHSAQTENSHLKNTLEAHKDCKAENE